MSLLCATVRRTGSTLGCLSLRCACMGSRKVKPLAAPHAEPHTIYPDWLGDEEMQHFLEQQSFVSFLCRLKYPTQPSSLPAHTQGRVLSSGADGVCC